MTKSPFIFFGITTLLIAALGLVIYGQPRPSKRTFHGQLSDLLPPAPLGWTRTTRPIADTPEMKQKISELLNYDDGIYYDYTTGSLRLSVYVAYWEPGKMSSRLVAGHTPDICWISAGWICTERNEIKTQVSSPPSLPLHSTPGSVTGQDFSSRAQVFVAESRTFVINNTTEYVWFWHLADGISQSHQNEAQPPWFSLFNDIFSSGLDQRAEQFFVRLSSPQKINDPALAIVLTALLRTLPVPIAQPNS